MEEFSERPDFEQIAKDALFEDPDKNFSNLYASLMQMCSTEDGRDYGAAVLPDICACIDDVVHYLSGFREEVRLRLTKIEEELGIRYLEGDQPKTFPPAGNILERVRTEKVT